MLFRFEDCALDIDRRELRRGGVLVPVEPLVFDLLAYLIRHRDRVVSQDDLFAGVWERRIVSESTLRVRINAARAAIGDNGEEQRLIKTLPRKGFRFVGLVREEAGAAEFVEPEPLETTPVGPVLPATQTGTHTELIERPAIGLAEVLPPRPLSPAVRSRSFVLVGIGAGLGVAAVIALFLVWSNLNKGPTAVVSRPLPKFDVATVPLISDAVRKSLVSYPDRPDAKALALAIDGWGVADGAPDIAAAEGDALRQCSARAKRPCRIYARGMDVMWSKESLPLAAAADLRLEPLGIALAAEDVPTISLEARRRIAERYLPGSNHKALALASGGVFYVPERLTRTEAIRLALEGCGEFWRRPCLLLSVDGFLTMEIPKSRKLVGVFLPSVETGMADADKERIGSIYKGADWRALARGKSGWHAVAAQSSEDAAIAAAVKSCSEKDSECRLHAIGNFRVADE